MSDGGGLSVGTGTVKREPQDGARSWGWDSYCQPYPGRSRVISSFSPFGRSRVAIACRRYSYVREGVALAEGLVLLGVEGLSFQVDLTYLRAMMKVRSHKARPNGRGPFPSSPVYPTGGREELGGR